MPTEMSTAPKPRSSSRKYVILGLVALLVMAGWSGFWYFSYTKTQNLVDRLMARQINGTQVLSCQDQKLGGYPFRLFLTCSSYKVQDAKSGWQAEGGALRAIWQVYAPNLALIETDDHLKLFHVPSEQSYEMKSDLMRGSVRFSPTDFVARGSFEANNPVITSTDPKIAKLAGQMSAKKLALHVRPTPDTVSDLDLSFQATDFTAGPVPTVSGHLGFTALEGLSEAIRSQGNPARAWLQQSGKIKNIDGQIEIGQKTLVMKGDVAFSDQGLANGLVKLTILNPPAEAAGTAKTLTAKRDGLNGPLTALQLMGKPVKHGDLIGSEIDIKLKDGNIRAGLLPLGQLPPLR